ncbi:M24 family metallopeptidase [Telmatocola sphagniphila]|uniref:M24 family metallopeptidase n=1 Tax=Telmatocola sphagniphila TaxID=1123043 RepID=A0A8E6B881_9BACT|nr:M24 family metallopeptidase [Telmatocola sphagniphila]QVL32931.1 M24 family metallopeptidase [Telmatocola sphagniphila]
MSQVSNTSSKFERLNGKSSPITPNHANGPLLPTMHIEPTRRSDVDARQVELSKILVHAGCDWCLLFDPANISWITAGMQFYEWYPESEKPVIFVNLMNRSVICSTMDTQPLFDNDLDGLGFGVKEYPWHLGRDRYLEQLTMNRKVACDRPFKACIDISETLGQVRSTLSEFEQTRYRELGHILAHAVEATARNIQPGESEIEIAGQLGHRLVKRGLLPISLSVIADDRLKQHYRSLPTKATVNNRCLIHATASAHGLVATASRTVCFGKPDEELKVVYDQVCRLQSILRSRCKPGELVKTVLRVGQAFLLNTEYEHEWRKHSFGCRIGRSSMEGRLLHAGSDATFLEGQPIAWETTLGSYRIVETIIPQKTGEESITGPLEWPIRRVRLSDMTFSLPDYLVVP